MGAGSAKGVTVTEEEDDGDTETDRFSIISQVSPEPERKPPQSGTDNNKANVQAKIEALTAADTDDETGAPDEEKREDEKKRGLFGFSRRRDEENKSQSLDSAEAAKRGSKRESGKSFRFFNFRKESKKSEEKDEKLEEEINDLQKTFDSLGIVGNNLWDEKSDQKAKRTQSADDIRELEPMRNRLNQKRRFSRPANAGTSIKRFGEGLTSSGGSRRTFKYSWETENMDSATLKSEEWNYETVTIDGFDLEKFQKANLENQLMMDTASNKTSNSFGLDKERDSSSGTRSPLAYDPIEQKILANIEREFI